MSMVTTHLLCAVIFTVIGIWVGRKTSLLSGFIKGGAA
jgi:hypothetical protein